LIDDLGAAQGHDGAGRTWSRSDVAARDHDRRKHHEVDHGAKHNTGRDADAHQSADAEHRRIERQAQAEGAEVGAEDLRRPQAPLRRQQVVVMVEPLLEVPRLGHSGPAVHPQEAELHQPLQPVADEKLIDRSQSGGDAEQLRLVDAFAGGAVVERIEHHAAGAAFGERQLIFVDEAALHREGDEHADERHDHHPDEHLPPRHDHAGHHHVSSEAGDERRGHVTGRGRDRLHRVVLENGEIVRHAHARQEAEHREGEDHRGKANAEGYPRLAADVKIGRGEDSAEQETGQA
jgi:hypothetical protein